MPEAIAAFTSDHIDAYTTLFVDVYNSQPWNEQWTYDNARELLQETLRIPGFVGVVSIDEELLGFAVGYCERGDEGRRFFLKEICVRPERQRQGVGTRLLQRLESLLIKPRC